MNLLNSKVAICCFVKTPGLSPSKTRLIPSLGPERTLSCYLSLVEIVRDLFNECKDHPNMTPVWVVQEQMGLSDPLWQTHQSCLQFSSTDLGPKLFNLQESISQYFEKWIFIGSDCPALSLELVVEAVKALEKYDHAIGPSKDGGYYLYASKVKLSEQAWLAPSYSTQNTLQEFLQNITGEVYLLPELTDLDDENDIEGIKSELVLSKTENQNVRNLLNILGLHETADQERKVSSI